VIVPPFPAVASPVGELFVEEPEVEVEVDDESAREEESIRLARILPRSAVTLISPPSPATASPVWPVKNPVSDVKDVSDTEEVFRFPVRISPLALSVISPPSCAPSVVFNSASLVVMLPSLLVR
jgi:hypothetical protein